ncbi:MAG: DUF1501 domain-containing protein [Planctomycetota bacterium]|nr:DUF1501 domain-containing protein [Planctomycetota bacterium]
MLTIQGANRNKTQPFNRREILQAGGAGLLGLNLPGLLAAEQATPRRQPRAKSVIFMFLFGGPSQLESFDMKPTAPEKIRGPFKPTPARSPDLKICEHLSRLAAISDKYAVVKTMSHSYNDHSGAGHYIQTGHRWNIPIGGGFNVTPNDWPSMGSVVKQHDLQHAGQAHLELPSYVVVPNSLGRLQDYKVQLRRPGETAGWLGRSYDPLNTVIDKRDSKDNPYFRDCTDEELDFAISGLQPRAGISLDRIKGRASLLDQFNQQRHMAENALNIDAMDQFRKRALDLVASDKTRQALDLQQEASSLRDQYGRHLFGQSTLMARRLVEAGVRFVTVHYDCVDGYSWDSHRTSNYLEKNLLPTFDQALSALLTDLEQRGLLDETLVVAMGEMGRTPKANDKWGRGHWSTLFPAVLAGAGIQGGLVYGETDRDAGYATSRPTSPEDLAATIYDALGIDYQGRIYDRFGRPHNLVNGGQPVYELFG